MEKSAAVLEVESADAWQDVVSSCFVPLSCLGFEASFRGRMEHVRLDDALTVSLVTTSGTSAERTDRLATRAGSDDLHLSLQRSSTGLVCAGGTAVGVRPGAVTVYATDAPYYLDYSSPRQQQLIAQVSRASLGLPAAMLDAARRRLSLGPTPAARTLFGFVAGLVPGLGGDTRDDAGAVARDLAVAMLRTSFATAPVLPETRGGLQVAILDFVRTHACDPALDVAGIAQRHFMSRRRLYDLFDDLGATPGDHLRTVRLEAAAHRLREPGRELTIAEIARSCGFADATTFTRAFRRAYDTAPRDYRAAG